MRLTFVCKRRPQQRDLLARPYGRFHHIPRELAALGHEVQLVLVSHQRLPAERHSAFGMRIDCLDLLDIGRSGVTRHLRRTVGDFSPDWIVGLSDAVQGCLAHRLAAQLGTRLAIDAYDNYESYMPWNLPLTWRWRRALRDASLVTAAGPQLAARMQAQRSSSARPVQLLPMTADPAFVPMDGAACREALGLPTRARLVGYLGSWGPERGTEVILPAYRRIRETRPDVSLVVSGNSVPDNVRSEPGVIALGYVPDDDLPRLVNALDVAAVITAETAFGAFSYPSKLCEALACGVPVVASATDAIRWMLGGAGATVPIGDAAALATAVLQGLEHPRGCARGLPKWSDLASDYAVLLQAG